MAKERRVIERIVRRSRDDTERYVPEAENKLSGLVHEPSGFPAVNSDRSIDSFLALQLGLWQILSALDMWSVDTEALLRSKLESRRFRFERIFFDWAEMTDDRIPNNSATIQQQGPTRYSYSGRETSYLEDTVDYFCKGTVLKLSHTAEATLSMVSWLNSKDDRGGVRKAIEDAFDEYEDERAGRRVVIPQYYERSARYSLQEIDYPDRGDSATDNTWPIVARFSADIDVVKLVKAPGYIREVAPNVLPGTSELPGV